MAAPEEPGDAVAIRARALQLLARREHAPRELRAKLARRGFDTDAIGAVIDELAAEGLLSEARFAESMARTRVERGHGPRRIAAELAAKGVDETLVEQALAGLDVDWAELAAHVRRKRFGEARPADFAAKARQMRFLQRRGFDADAIRGALDLDD